MKTWGDLLMPEYMLAALEAFLVAALPVWGLGSIDTESTSRALVLPTLSMIVGGGLAGLLNTVRALRTVAMHPPRAGNEERRAVPPPAPGPGG